MTQLTKLTATLLTAVLASAIGTAVFISHPEPTPTTTPTIAATTHPVSLP